MRYFLLALLATVLASCSLEKRVTVSTSGYDTYIQANYSDAQLKSLQLASPPPSSSMTVYSSKKKKK